MTTQGRLVAYWLPNQGRAPDYHGRMLVWDGEQLWVVEVEHDGWAKRRRYSGTVYPTDADGLSESASRVLALVTGLPGFELPTQEDSRAVYEEIAGLATGAALLGSPAPPPRTSARPAALVEYEREVESWPVRYLDGGERDVAAAVHECRRRFGQ